MILAQATTHTNSLYHEWGLISAALGFCIPLLGGVWWLLKIKSEETSDSALKIQSGLAGLMERTFHIEALRVLGLIDDHLPDALSQVDVKDARPSAFDRLCLGLRVLDLDEPDRNKFRALLERALSGIISAEAKKLLTGASPTGLQFSFRHETERLLVYIAEQTARSKQNLRTYDRATSWATRLFIVGPIATLLATPWVMIDALWAYYLNVICLSVFGLASGLGLFSLLRLAVCQNWLKKRARWGLKDWGDDFS